MANNDRWRDEDRFRRGQDRGGYGQGGYEQDRYGSQERRGFYDFGSGRNEGEAPVGRGGGREPGYPQGGYDRDDDYGQGGRRGRGEPGRRFSPDRDYGQGYGGGYYGMGGGGYGSSTSDYGRGSERGYGGDYGYSRGSYGYGERNDGRDAGSGSGAYGHGRADREDRYRGGGRGERDERGFFDRAGDEIASWFGDDEAARRRRHDERQGPSHRGRGPKNYTRSDDRIQEDVSDRLYDDPHIDASHIEVSVSGGEVTLNGFVNSRFDKRHAEDIADTVSGVRHVQNNLRVNPDQGLPTDVVPGSQVI